MRLVVPTTYFPPKYNATFAKKYPNIMTNGVLVKKQPGNADTSLSTKKHPSAQITIKTAKLVNVFMP
jgi:hypothetical protein